MKQITLSNIQKLLSDDPKKELISKKIKNKLIFEVEGSNLRGIFIPNDYLTGTGEFYLMRDIAQLTRFKCKIKDIKKR